MLDEQFSVYLIKNTSTGKKVLVDFLTELVDVDPVINEYPFFRLWTDTYGIHPRVYLPGVTYEVKFVVDVCVLGRMMVKIKNNGILPSFKYVRIRDHNGFQLSDGERLEDPYNIARKSAVDFIEGHGEEVK